MAKPRVKTRKGDMFNSTIMNCKQAGFLKKTFVKQVKSRIEWNSMTCISQMRVTLFSTLFLFFAFLKNSFSEVRKQK